jgi:hypothetical protein
MHGNYYGAQSEFGANELPGKLTIKSALVNNSARSLREWRYANSATRIADSR